MKSNNKDKNRPIKVVFIYYFTIIIFFVMMSLDLKGNDFWHEIDFGVLDDIFQILCSLCSFLYIDIFQILCSLCSFLYIMLAISGIGLAIAALFPLYFGVLIMKYAPKLNDWIYIIKNIVYCMVLMYISSFISVFVMENLKFRGIKMLYHSYILFYMKLNIIPMLIGITGGYIWRRLSD